MAKILNGIDSQRKDTIHNNQENLIYLKTIQSLE